MIKIHEFEYDGSNYKISSIADECRKTCKDGKCLLVYKDEKHFPFDVFIANDTSSDAMHDQGLDALKIAAEKIEEQIRNGAGLD
jgi:hypothetical protein